MGLHPVPGARGFRWKFHYEVLLHVEVLLPCAVAEGFGGDLERLEPHFCRVRDSELFQHDVQGFRGEGLELFVDCQHELRVNDIRVQDGC